MKLDILMHYNVNETTGEITFIGKEEVSVDTISKKSTTVKKVDNNPNPLITLDTNKLILTQGAVDMLNICPDCRVDIKYKKKDKTALPVIGSDSAFKTKSGNKLTRNNTISFRGAANERLSTYGTIFKMEPTEDEGIYYLIGDKEQEEDIPTPEEIINIEEELDALDLDNINNDTDDLTEFNKYQL